MRKQRRGFMLGGAVILLTVAVGLIAFAMRDTIVFFYAPSELEAKAVEPGQRIRLGGLVADGSIVKSDNAQVRFIVTDTLKSVPVVYRGILPDLFREGQGVVTEGRLDAAGTFRADTVLAKHDENYMPKEVADALKARGVKLGEKTVHPGAASEPTAQ